MPKMLVGKFLFKEKKKEKMCFVLLLTVLAKFFNVTKEERLNKFNMKVA